MRFSDDAHAALQKPDTKAIAIEMTPERKEKFSRIGVRSKATVCCIFASKRSKKPRAFAAESSWRTMTRSTRKESADVPFQDFAHHDRCHLRLWREDDPGQKLDGAADRRLAL